MTRFQRRLPAFALLISFLVWNIPMGSAQTVQGSVVGIVKNAEGQPLPGARLILKEGDAILSTVSGEKGEYRIASPRAGAYTLKVHCEGYSDVVEIVEVIPGSKQLTLNFILNPLAGAKVQPAAPFGRVKFYEGSRFATGQLENPAAGGGYSDSASIAGAAMIRQYLIPSPSLPSPPNTLSGKLPAGRNPTTKTFDNTGAEMLARKDFVKAAAWFRDAVAHDPQSARNRMGLGISLYGQGKYSAAVETLSQAANLAPDNPAPELLLAEAARFSPHHQHQVSRLLHRFTAMHPTNAEGHYAYAMDLWEIFRLRHAQRILAQARSENEKAVALAPGFPAGHFQLGVLYDQEEMTAQAIQQYRETIRLNPDLSTAHYRLAQDLLRSGSKNEARTEIEAYEKLRVRGDR